MKHTLYSKHHTTIAPLLADTTKESLKAVHTAAVSKSRRKQTVNRVLRDRPPDISETETSLRRPQRTTLSQLRSGHCHLLNSYKHRIGLEDDPQCKDCGYNNQDVNHLFDCPAHPTVVSPTKLWSMPADTTRHASHTTHIYLANAPDFSNIKFSFIICIYKQYLGIRLFYVSAHINPVHGNW